MCSAGKRNEGLDDPGYIISSISVAAGTIAIGTVAGIVPSSLPDGVVSMAVTSSGSS